MALSPDGARLYVVCGGTDELVVIDLHSKSIAGRVAVGRVPRGIAVARDGARLYVTNSWSDTVSEIDAAALRVVRTLPAGFEPIGAALDQHGFLYVANRLGNDVSVIDLATGADTRAFGGRPRRQLDDSLRRWLPHLRHPHLSRPRRLPQPARIGNHRNRYRPPGSRGAPPAAQRRWCVSRGVLARRPLRHRRADAAQEPDPAGPRGARLGFRQFAGGVRRRRRRALVQLPLDQIESFFSLPFGVAMAPDKSRVYISASGSNEVAVLDVRRLLAAARAPGAAALANDLSASAEYVLARIPVGQNPAQPGALARWRHALRGQPAGRHHLGDRYRARRGHRHDCAGRPGRADAPSAAASACSSPRCSPSATSSAAPTATWMPLSTGFPGTWSRTASAWTSWTTGAGRNRRHRAVQVERQQPRPADRVRPAHRALLLPLARLPRRRSGGPGRITSSRFRCAPTATACQRRTDARPGARQSDFRAHQEERRHAYSG